ncbi:Uncharacterised protein [Klebsiella variicola]|nr:Uncharacterised protein [Klebsiella variicola]
MGEGKKHSRRAAGVEILGCNHAVDGRFGIGLRFGRHFRAVSDTFGEHKVHVGDADEAEEGGQVRGDQVVGVSLWIPPRLVTTTARLPVTRPSGPFSV